MGWEGVARGSSPPLFEHLIQHFEQQVPRLMQDASDEIEQHVVSNTRKHTPTAGADAATQNMPYRGSTDVPGKLLKSVKGRGLHVYSMPGGILVYETGAETDVDYGSYVENGTGLWGPEHAKYKIEPKLPGGVLTWIDRATGHRVFAKWVMHPGSPGHHMFAIGVAETEGEFNKIVQRALGDFRRRCDRYRDNGGYRAGMVKRIA